MDILKEITDALPKVITDAEFEAANIVIYTDNADFLSQSTQSGLPEKGSSNKFPSPSWLIM